jgi:MoaA/NifB/PqqE/SkfB family radical SAM enzyme
MSHNYYDLTNFAEWAVKLGIDRISFQPIQNVHNYTGEKQQDIIENNPLYQINNLKILDDEIEGLNLLKKKGVPIWNNYNELELIKNYFHNFKSAINKQKCDIGFYTMLVNPVGNVKLCGLYNLIGNIKSSHIKDIWFSNLAHEQRKKMANCREICLLSCNRKYSLKDKIKIGTLLLKNS